MAEFEVPDYSWVRDYGRSKIAQAACITVATCLSCEEVLLALGADLDSGTLPWADLSQIEEPTVAVVAAGDAVVAVEPNGWQGNRPEVLRPLSRSGRAASTYWNTDSDMKVSVAEGGRLLCTFDPVAPDRRQGDNPAVVEPLIGDLDFAAGAWAEQCMILVERFTGVRVTPEMVAGLNRVSVITPVLEDKQTVPAVEQHPLRRDEPGAAVAIAALPPERQRRLAQQVALQAVVATGLADHPAVKATISAFSQPISGPTAELDAFVRQISADATRTKDYGPWKTLGPGIAAYREPGPETRKASQRRAAAQALRAAVHPDPLTAALDTVHAALSAFPDDQTELVKVIRRELA
jgi:hypothetical protein